MSTIMSALKRCHWRRFGIFIANVEHASYLILLFLLFNFEHVIVGWVTVIFFSEFQGNYLQ